MWQGEGQGGGGAAGARQGQALIQRAPEQGARVPGSLLEARVLSRLLIGRQLHLFH